MLRKIMSAFLDGISDVFFTGSDPEMVGVYAWRVIAGMANKKPVGDLSLVENPRNPMGFLKFVSIFNDSITFFGLGSFPNPAGSSFVDFSEKPFCFHGQIIPILPELFRAAVIPLTVLFGTAPA